MNSLDTAPPRSTALPVPAALRTLVARLPIRPPSFALALALDRLLRPRLAPDVAQQLAGQVVEIEVCDLGLRCRVMLTAAGFRAVADGGPVTLRVAADAASYLRLLRGEEDADRLFFERALVMEGDTEYGLILKNTLDALGPLLRWPPLSRG
ncbi:MAG: SCP2 sterol-binding domain-containing protein [Burkholderiales bacterium]|nr:SCP2 sterol-binding domain-containing protein [Burkholderiales bacterium]OJX02468.1 MAG: sterol-binding protein [Burkholderiales bacterium 70-64]